MDPQLVSHAERRPNSCIEVNRLFECNDNYVPWNPDKFSVPLFPDARQRSRLRKYVCHQCNRRSYNAIVKGLREINMKRAQQAGTTDEDIKAWLDLQMDRVGQPEDPQHLEGGSKKPSKRSKKRSKKTFSRSRRSNMR
jgi:hypothetical protein